MRRLFAAFALLFFFSPGMVLAGNREMIEREQRQLNQLREQMVEELGPVAGEGALSLRGRALPQKEGYIFVLEQKNGAGLRSDAEGYERFGDGLRRYLRIPAEIVLRQGQEEVSDAHYTSFSSAMRRYLKGGS